MDSPSTPLSRRRPRSPPVTDGQRSPPAKRQRQISEEPALSEENAVTIPAKSTTEDSSMLAASIEYIPSALRLVQALDQVRFLEAIGYCPGKMSEIRRNMMTYAPDDLTEDQIVFYNELTRSERKWEKRNAAVVQKIAEIHSEHAHNSASGYVTIPFSLRIRRTGCEYDGIVPLPTSFNNETPVYDSGEKTALQQRLQSWYDSADISGYGDVREQITKVDADIRQAREIPSSEFDVDSTLIAQIAGLWDKHFYPNEGVRVEPYKIHLYGPGDHFREHRDTPQQDLVGTFLLGLGDTTYGGGLVVDGNKLRADQGHWCAFYPDVPHMVEKINQGYRAVIAFKIFRDPSADGETSTSSEVRQKVSELVNQLRAPYGILLERKYCLGTTHLSGFDALIYNSLLDVENVEARHLPVVVRVSAAWGSYNRDDQEADWETSCEVTVFPFTRGHIDTLGHFANIRNDPQHTAYKGPTDHTSCGCPWLEGVRNVPFFSFDLSRSLVVYSEDHRETCNYYGNEAQAWRDDSVYLTYALLVVPKASPETEGAESDGSSSSDSDSEEYTTEEDEDDRWEGDDDEDEDEDEDEAEDGQSQGEA